MDYRPPSQYNHQNQELEWMSRMASSSNTSNNNTSATATRIEILDKEDDGGGNENNKSVVIEREHMFDKVVTPSDVGKLNRLVIPKQHAEKYFPLDSSNNEKGLLLNFEDRTGKPWRFRYSYWNSSQSYVMTKGWSRFVKEKKLDAGDIVSFQRGVGDVGKDRLFIDWRRRPDASASGLLPYASGGTGAALYPHQYFHSQGRTVPGMGWGTSSGSPPFVLRSHPHPHQSYSYPLGLQGGPSGIWDQQGGGTSHPTTHLSTMSLMNVLPSTQTHHYPGRRGMGLGGGDGGGGGYGFGYGNVVNPQPYPVIFLRPTSTTTNGVATLSSTTEEIDQQRGTRSSQVMMMQVQGDEGGEEGMVYESVPVVQGKAAAKRLRLFGVNMECPISHQTHDFDILSSSLASSSTHNHHQNDHDVAISMGLTSSPSPPHHQHLRPLSSSPSSSFYNGTSSSVPLEKGKSSTSSSMSLDLDI